MKLQIRLFVTIGSALMLSAPAAAQDFVLPPLIDNVGMGNIAIGAAARPNANRNRVDTARIDNPQMPLALPLYPATQTPTAANMDFSYRYSKARTRKNLKTFVDRTENPAAKAELKKVLDAQPTVFDDLRAAIGSYGLDTHDVADAYALWWINAWLVANKRGEDPDKGTIAMVKQQTRNAFAATPDFARTTDEQRQEYAEALLLQATMLSSAFEQRLNEPAMLDQLADAASKGAKASGLDLSLMTLTKQGFVPRAGADAGDSAAQDAQPVRNASADEVGGDNTLGLALAAGAGLGVILVGGIVMIRQQG
ncbi:MAG: DUF6683 family protein [Erythrobacter sp.]